MPYDNYALEHGRDWLVMLARRTRLPVFRHTAVFSAGNEDLRAVAIQRRGRSYLQVQEAANLAFSYNIASNAVGELKKADRDLSVGKPIRALTGNTVEYLRDNLNVVLDGDRPVYTLQTFLRGHDDYLMQTVHYRAVPGYDAFPVHAAQLLFPGYCYPGAPFAVGSTTAFLAVRLDQITAPANCVHRSPPGSTIVHELAAAEHRPADRQPPNRQRCQHQAFTLPSIYVTALTDRSDSMASPGHRDASFDPTTLRVDERPLAGGRRAGVCEC